MIHPIKVPCRYSTFQCFIVPFSILYFNYYFTKKKFCIVKCQYSSISNAIATSLGAITIGGTGVIFTLCDRCRYHLKSQSHYRDKQTTPDLGAIFTPTFNSALCINIAVCLKQLKMGVGSQKWAKALTTLCEHPFSFPDHSRQCGGTCAIDFNIDYYIQYVHLFVLDSWLLSCFGSFILYYEYN